MHYLDIKDIGKLYVYYICTYIYLEVTSCRGSQTQSHIAVYAEQVCETPTLTHR